MYTIEQKAQIEIIKNSFYSWGEFDDYVLIVDGHKGVYIPKNQLRVVLDPNRRADMDIFDPQGFKEYKEAHITKWVYALSNTHMARKIEADDIAVWVREDWLKQYRDAVSYRIKDTKSPLIVYGRCNKLIGIILPVKINRFD